METEPKYKRILLKISGEALAGEQKTGLDFGVIGQVCDVIKACTELGVQVGVVIGGGNFWRGVKNGEGKMARSRADHMGMLATVMNAMALQDALRTAGIEARVQSALTLSQVAEPYIRGRALKYLEKGRVVIFAAGTGNPFFTTDTTAALRGAEIGAQIVLKATKVDGIYSEDPKKNPNAELYKDITFDEAMRRNLKVMDATAFALCRDQGLPIKVFSITKPGAMRRVVLGEDEGTLVHV